MTAARTSSHNPPGQLFAVAKIVVASVRRDREAGRHGQAGLGHLRETRSFAAEQVAHRRIALGVAVTPGVDVLLTGAERLRCRPLDIGNHGIRPLRLRATRSRENRSKNRAGEVGWLAGPALVRDDEFAETREEFSQLLANALIDERSVAVEYVAGTRDL